jgi:hypothetical protein
MCEGVALEPNLLEYFRLRIEEAREDHRVDLTDEGVLYLAQLLADRARADRVSPPETTLVELHAKACQASPAEQASTWRELGDRALYGLGYFPEHIDGKLVSRDYYAAMGTSAYLRVDDVLKRWFADAFGPIFRELAAGFRGCVSLLGAVREQHESRNDLTELYEEWLATGSEDVAAKLRRRGLVLSRRLLLES